MAVYFDEEKWTEALKHPDWYLRLHEDYQRLMRQAKESSKDISEAIKEELYQFFEDRLANNDVALDREGPSWDSERKPIDTAVIHHTKNPPEITWQRLNAMHLLRIYASYYASPQEHEVYIKGQPIYSGHFRDGHQVSYAYHWLIRMDGGQERLLADTEIGWQAGKWEVNCRSVGICLDNDFENSSPSELVLSSVTNLIQARYPQISRKNIVGHREVNQKTTCPSNLFLNGWKVQLLNLIKK